MTKDFTVKTKPVSENTSLEQPFPLKTLFRKRFIPAMIGFVIVFLVLIGFTAGQVVESIYLELAQRRAQTIARAVASKSPQAWQALMSGETIQDLRTSGGASNLMASFFDEVRELGLVELKVYDLNRKVIFATHMEEIGTTENGPALVAVIEDLTSEIVTKTLDDGSQQYELYVPVFDDGGQIRTVFELYEPVGYLDAILIRAAVPILAIPALLFLIFTFALNKLVTRAQIDIDIRTEAINELRTRIESFVSNNTVNAARMADSAGAIESRALTTTLFFSDIRDFTGYSEQNSPETVVEFLNRVMTLQVEVIRRHGGDIDKMIGDAVLARFDSPDGSKQAIRAAGEILSVVKQGNYPRSLGVGIYRGNVISGAIGPEDRRDFTVIGDAVNVSARLCSAALAGEIVVEVELADDTFGPVEQVQVKGRVETVSIRRRKV